MIAATPDRAAFATAYANGTPQLVWTELIADLETPVAAYLKLSGGEEFSFLLESVEDGDIRGRYSMIGLAPDLLFRVSDGQPEINRNAQNDLDSFTPMSGAPLDALREVLAQSRLNVPEGLAPMSAGVFGYMAYDMVRHMEDLPDSNPDVMQVPDCLFMRPTLIAVFDSVTDNIRLVTAVRPDETDAGDANDAYDAALARLEAAEEKLRAALPDSALIVPNEFDAPQSNMSQDAYFEMVEKGKAYIEAGDVFQVVLSQRFNIDFDLPPFDLYRSLRRVNPSPYLFFLNMRDFAVVGSSPEVLVGVKDREVNIRPIAGTRKRGASLAEDEAISADLLSDEKERAEHLMLLDLGRNDVGRVSEIGSVKVNTAFGLQKTSHLIHIVSDVTGTLRQDLDEIDALVAGFPAGTVSGAPKIRAMEIIDELEPERRGIYSGCVGYFSANGDMDTCIALRTAVVKDKKLYVQAGGGVVYDSTPQYEYDETVNKAAALFRAAEVALQLAAERKNRP
jgi:anthranilate synthase component 1